MRDEAVAVRRDFYGLGSSRRAALVEGVLGAVALAMALAVLQEKPKREIAMAFV